MSVLGNRVLRVEDQRLLTEGARYVADLRFDGQAYVRFVRSTVAHGRLLGVDAGDAESRPGVLGVFTASDLDLPDLAPIPTVDQRMARPVLARDTVRFVGEPVAAVVAETVAEAADAAEHVVVSIEPLPAVVRLQDAVADSTLVHPEAGTNLAAEMTPAMRVAHGGSPPQDPVDARPRGDAGSRDGSGSRSDAEPLGSDTRLDFSGCEVVVAASLMNQRLAAVPLEPRSAAAVWDADTDRLTFYASTQAPHRVRDALAGLYGLEPEAVRVVVPDVGGGFGAKGSPTAEELLLAGLASAVGRPMSWTETRTENLTSSVHGRAQQQRVRMGGTRDGRITHYELAMSQDAGAYPMVGARLPNVARKVFTGCYDIANASATARSYATNTAPVAAYRGAGRPEATMAVERAVDLFAAATGLDAAEVRSRNLVAPEQMPYTNAADAVYDSGDYPEALRRALAAADYDGLRAEQARRRAADDPVLLGVGVACYVESASMGGSELGEVALAADGSLVVRSGATALGQGHDTSWSMIAASVTGVALDRIAVVSGDTDEIAHSQLTAGSRSAQLAGSAVHSAASRLVELARERAAELLEAAAADVVLDAVSGQFHVVGSPQPRVSWTEIAAQAEADGEPLAAESDFVQEASTFPAGCHVAAVEVDSLTGEATLRRIVACDDAGTLINPMIVEGQIHGGVAQGAAQALLEEAVYDADGNPLTGNLADYPAITSDMMTRIELAPLSTPTPLNPLGAKGIGESGAVGASAAIVNAVHDALSHRGVTHLEPPTTPQRIWKALSRHP